MTLNLKLERRKEMTKLNKNNLTSPRNSIISPRKSFAIPVNREDNILKPGKDSKFILKKNPFPNPVLINNPEGVFSRFNHNSSPFKNINDSIPIINEPPLKKPVVSPITPIQPPKKKKVSTVKTSTPVVKNNPIVKNSPSAIIVKSNSVVKSNHVVKNVVTPTRNSPRVKNVRKFVEKNIQKDDVCDGNRCEKVKALKQWLYDNKDSVVDSIKESFPAIYKVTTSVRSDETYSLIIAINSRKLPFSLEQRKIYYDDYKNSIIEYVKNNLKLEGFNIKFLEIYQ